MKLLLSALSALLFVSAHANNIQVNNVSLTGQNTVEGFTLVQFDLSWENSWRISSGPSNYDGVWVFIKYRQNNGAWQHATINYVNGTATSDGHTAPSGAVIQTSSDGVGAFVYRDTDGSGDIQFLQAHLRWNYGVDNVADAAIVDVQVYAIEMVYIPEGTYSLGSSFSGTEIDHFYTLSSPQFPVQFPYSVQSENAIPVSSAAGDLYYSVSGSGNEGDQLGPIPVTYPKGYAAYWTMKYEITEDQWICFFNALTETQKLIHDITDALHKNSDGVIARNTISYISGNASTSAPGRAVSYLSYEDCAAYLDWAGLRFMTELEYEKASKGPIHTPDMVASGATIAFGEPYSISNDGSENATITNPGMGITNMNFADTDPSGPMRVGIFAASAANPTRLETGGSYYGVMELSGNLYERCIGIGTPLNRSFTATHGNGELLSNGDHDVPTWPGAGSEGAHAYRGGSYVNALIFCRTADRNDSCFLGSITNSRIGIRGVRSAE